MTDIPGQSPLTRSKTDWTSWLQLVFSVIVFIALVGMGLLVLVSPVLSSLPGQTGGLSMDSMVLIMGFSMLALALFPLLSTITSALQLAGKKQPAWLTGPKNWLKGLPILVALLMLLAWFLIGRGANPVLLLSLLTMFCILLPITWLARVGSGKEWGNFPKRDAGLLTFSIGFSTPLILLVELILVFILLVVFGFVVAAIPGLQQVLEQVLTNWAQYAQDPEQLLEALRPLLTNGWVIGLLFFLLSGLAPLVEELLKTLGVWFLKNQAITPAQGFVAGVMSGAGFALVEGLFNATQALSGSSGADWLFLILGRFGGSLLHIFNGGLMGWALAKTWQDRKVWRVVGIFALVFVLHGVWNAFALAAGVFPFLQGGLESTSWYYLPLGVIFVVVLAAFLAVSRRLTGGSKVRELL